MAEKKDNRLTYKANSETAEIARRRFEEHPEFEGSFSALVNWMFQESEKNPFDIEKAMRENPFSLCVSNGGNKELYYNGHDGLWTVRFMSPLAVGSQGFDDFEEAFETLVKLT